MMCYSSPRELTQAPYAHLLRRGVKDNISGASHEKEKLLFRSLSNFFTHFLCPRLTQSLHPAPPGAKSKSLLFKLYGKMVERRFHPKETGSYCQKKREINARKITNSTDSSLDDFGW